MAVATALNAALSGLRAAQSSIDVVAGNIANADNPDYTKKRSVTEATVGNVNSSGVRFVGVERVLDELILRQSRSESSALSSLNVKNDYYQRLDSMLGQPGSANALDTILNNFTGSLEALATTPESFPAQSNVLSASQILVQTLNSFSNNIQNMRTQTEEAMTNAVNQANQLLQDIEKITETIIGTSASGQIPPDLLDQRDKQINALAEIIDIRVTNRESGSISINTTSGLLLFDKERSILSFDRSASLTPTTLFNNDPALSNIGSLGLQDSSGFPTDLIAGGHLRSGSLAGLVEMRDVHLVEMQARLDELAENLALSLSNRTQQGTALPAPIAGSDGFAIDLAGLQPGNKVTVSYNNLTTGTAETMTLVHVTDPAVLPLSNDVTARADDQVIGADLTNAADVSARLAAVGIALSGNAGAGTVLNILDDGGANTTTITNVTASITVTDLQSGGPELPFFTDGCGVGSLYTGNVDDGFSRIGLAQRIQVNDGLIADPNRLVAMDGNTAASDATRPEFLRQRMIDDQFLFRANTGIGADTTPYSATISSFTLEIVNRTATEADFTRQAQEGQQIVFNGLLARQQDISSVNIDEEIANLTQLQNSYAANARVLTVAQELLDLLLAI